MPHSKPTKSSLIGDLCRYAARHSGVTEGIACKGTALERRTYKVRNKAFLFVGASDVMLKLSQSLSEAIRLAAKLPECYQAGKTGWTKVTWHDDVHPDAKLIKRWIDESYGLFASPSPGARRKTASHPRKKDGRKQTAASRRR